MSNLPHLFVLPYSHEVFVSVPRNRVNQYLSRLWDELTRSIAPIICQHTYSPTSNPELYIYRIDWSDPSLPFDAQLFFFNHTAKGINKINVAVINRENQYEHEEIAEKIVNIITKTQNTLDITQSALPTAMVRVPVRTSWNLSGAYQIQDMILYPSQTKPNIDKSHRYAYTSYLEFPVNESTQPQIFIAAYGKAQDVVAALTLLTQNLFTVEYGKTHILDIGEYSQTICNKVAGQFVPDDSLIGEWPKPNVNGVLDLKTSQDIVEPSDVLIDQEIALPIRIEEAAGIIFDDENLLQSARRFQEGLAFQNEFQNEHLNGVFHSLRKHPLGEMLIPYQIIALVSSIEALLDTEIKEVSHICKKCGYQTSVSKRRVFATFMEFVDVHSGSSPAMKKIFNDVYSDRSKFVHTGKDLYDPSVLKPNRPLILQGKNYKSPLPKYHNTLPELTGWLLRRFVYQQLVERESSICTVI